MTPIATTRNPPKKEETNVSLIPLTKQVPFFCGGRQGGRDPDHDRDDDIDIYYPKGEEGKRPLHSQQSDIRRESGGRESKWSFFLFSFL